MRIGFGYDVHRFVTGRPLVLGGVEVEHAYGLAGHSDADVLLHAVMDALLGAAGLGDIGRHFPPSDPAYRGISSLQLLARVKALLDEGSFTVSNVDATVVCEAPRILPYARKMAERISEVLSCPVERINIKGTTTEGLGFTGTGEGMAAYAVALLEVSL